MPSRCYKEHDVTNFPIEEENEKIEEVFYATWHSSISRQSAQALILALYTPLKTFVQVYICRRMVIYAEASTPFGAWG